MKTKSLCKLALTCGISLLIISCGGGDKNDELDDKPTEQLPPVSTVLISPAKDESCNQGNVLEDVTLSTVTFNWNTSENTDTYLLKVISLEDNYVYQLSVATTSAMLDLKRGVSYQWFVTSKSSKTAETAVSETWEFYNAAEGTQTHVPYPASLELPTNKSTTASTTVLFQWSASDIDNDIESYEVYLGTTQNQLVKQAAVLIPEITMNLQVATTYYWNVYTKDTTGNVSISSIFEFTTP